MLAADASVSIVTRTSNRSILLRRAIRSVLAQTHPFWTHIIVNDGGNRDEVETLVSEFHAEYAGRVIVVHTPQSSGREAASNKGLEKCTSRYVTFLDDDDTWHPDFMTCCLSALQTSYVKNTRAVACATMRINERIDENGHITETTRTPFHEGMVAVEITRLCTNNTIPNMSLIFERSLLDEIGSFDESLPVLGDWDFNLRLALATHIHFVAEFLAFYHHRPDSTPLYSNSYYMHKDHLFKVCRTQIINKWIRAEYKKGTFSVADTMAFAALNYEGHTFGRRANKLLNLFTRIGGRRTDAY